MGEKDNTFQRDNLPDIPHLIRSIQRIKGNPDCFGMIAEDCLSSTCCWYELCFKISIGPLVDPSREDT